MFIPGSRIGQPSSFEFTIMSQSSAGSISTWPTLPQLTGNLPLPTSGPGEVHILPFPMPGDGPHILPFPGTGAGTPGGLPSVSLPERVAGTEGDDRIEVPTGAVAAGLGGDDVFVLTPGDVDREGQPLAVITDFNAGDSLDLSRLGPDAKILGREESDRPWGADRVSIDFNGDGAEDGFVMLAGRGPDLGAYRPYPMPIAPGDGLRPLFTGAVTVAVTGDASGIRLMGDHSGFDGLDLSLV
ncbi:MAG: hypothetical protein B7Z12_00395 [Caulobacter vibrioides]|uniref:Uncharacterized protein n=1 Tax=Caulobacter vibrioides TaxID=155892 RepID=A0A258DGV9_CAUVI|nr:MAG: hypothetical protein B7Z12_00395 [Caulobacter vibrioides]